MLHTEINRGGCRDTKPGALVRLGACRLSIFMKRSLRKKNLKKGKQLQAGGFITNPTYRQIIQPHLKWLLDKRDTAARMDRVGINAAIILFSAIYLEGFLEEV